MSVHFAVENAMVQVRSLELDYWEADTVLYMTKLGNVQVRYGTHHNLDLCSHTQNSS